MKYAQEVRALIESSLRIQSRQFYRNILSFFTRELDENNLGRSAIIFSPHPDDETLGCGGTIIRKKRAGAKVNIIFIADGSQSHPHLIQENKLKSIRANEALAASRKLGVEKKDVFFLGFKDKELSKNQDSAIPKVIEILFRQEPDEIFIPYRRETHPDHLATNKIVISALQIYGRKLIVYEYPIWFWRHWPWVQMGRETLGSWIKGFISGLYLIRDFHCSVYVADVLELKRAALVQHKSQMTRLIPDPNWMTLSDISNGEFLDCFFQDYEIFHRHIFLGRKATNY